MDVPALAPTAVNVTKRSRAGLTRVGSPIAATIVLAPAATGPYSPASRGAPRHGLAPERVRRIHRADRSRDRPADPPCPCVRRALGGRRPPVPGGRVERAGGRHGAGAALERVDPPAAGGPPA